MLLKFLGIFSSIATLLQPNLGGVALSPYEIPHLTPLPVKIAEISAPELTAESILIADLESGVILYEKNADARRFIASLTKLMTAIVILEENRLNNVITVSDVVNQVAGSRMWIVPKEKLTVESLLYGALVASANDAATALAVAHSGSTGAFVKKMNEKANRLGLHATHFSNPAGFDDEENFSTAKDVMALARYAYRKPFIRHAAMMKKLVVRSFSGKFTHTLETTNDLLFLHNSPIQFKGLKTGLTAKAGQSFVGIAENESGRKIVTVVLDSAARFAETKKLAEWTFTTYRW